MASKNYKHYNTKTTSKEERQEFRRNSTASNDKLEAWGVVDKAYPGTLFSVKIEEFGMELKCKISGKMRRDKVLVNPGDKVKIQLNVQDPTRGTIIWRGRST